MARHAQRSCRPTASSFCWSGVSPPEVLARSPAMRPTSVRMPVATTSARAEPAGDARSEEGEVAALGEGRVRGDRAASLLDGRGLSREGRLVRAQRRDLEEAGVGGDEVARVEHEQVAAHHLSGGEHAGATVPHDARPRSREAGQRRDRTLGAQLLDEPDRGVQDHDREDRAAVDELAEQRREEARSDEHPDHEAAELARQDREGPDGGLARELVRAVGREAPRRLFAGEARARGPPPARVRQPRRRARATVPWARPEGSSCRASVQRRSRHPRESSRNAAPPAGRDGAASARR